MISVNCYPDFHFVDYAQPEFVDITLPTDNKTPTHDIPAKSLIVYEAAYQKFIKWCEDKEINNYSENVLLMYFSDLATTMKMKGTSMWSQYSMIKSVLNIKQGIDISSYSELRAFLKKQNEGYIPKKSRVFTKVQFEKFLFEAPDDKYLGMKVVMLIGVSGACRCDELVKMKISDVEDLGSLLYIKITDTDTNKTRTFTIVGEKFINIYRKYVALRPARMDDGRLFIKYAYGKCHRSVMGINKIGGMPREVACYLKLPCWKEYTGRAFKGLL